MDFMGVVTIYMCIKYFLIGKIKYTNGGQNKAHNNIPLYITVYMWKRIN